jgi:type IV pilus assembly protein PilV
VQVETIRVRSSRGFTLIEALVALVVLSIGLLGVAALQITSLKMNHGSATRTQAVLLTYGIVDSMRANVAAAVANAYGVETPTASTVAGKDLIQWRQAIASTLPVGSIVPTGSVTYDAATKLFTVSITWDDAHARGASGAPNNEDRVTFSVTTQLSN